MVSGNYPGSPQLCHGPVILCLGPASAGDPGIHAAFGLTVHNPLPDPGDLAATLLASSGSLTLLKALSDTLLLSGVELSPFSMSLGLHHQPPPRPPQTHPYVPAPHHFQSRKRQKLLLLISA